MKNSLKIKTFQWGTYGGELDAFKIILNNGETSMLYGRKESSLDKKVDIPNETYISKIEV